jgi:beta-lactam-binding protein with PASTA domain/tRNA A-37 threonylcarbamoyl transferase component Bud32
MAAFGDDQVGRVLGGRYRLIAPVGTGASATVFLADDVQLQRRVAVKVLHPSLAEDAAFLKRFRAEAQAVAALAHPNVMAVYDWGQDGEESNATPYLVLEYLSGGSLRSMLDRGRQLTPSQALLVGLEAARGLDYAHRRGFVHRDIKPANLLFGEDRRLRIADFGLARAIAEAAWTEPDGVVLGTARYASPEQARGMAVDGKTDVYSLALTLIESVTGQVPFAADTTVATLMNRLDKLMPVSADLGPLASVLERAGRPEPADRYDAGELARALVQAAERLPRPMPLPLVPTLASAVGNGDDTTTLAAVPGGATRAAPTVASAMAGGGTRALAPPTGSARSAGSTGSAGSSGSSATAEMPRPAVPVMVGGVAVGDGSPGAGDPGPPSTPTIYNQERDRPDRKIGWFLVVLGVLVVAALGAGGILIFQRTRTQSHEVSNLVGLQRAEALNRIAEFDWKTDVQRLRSDAQPYDFVFDQSPKDGKLKEGGTLTLIVSDGPVLHALPDISQQPQDTAQAALVAMGLTMNVAGQQYDETLAANSILAWSVGGTPNPVGQQVPTGTGVDVVLSQGPAPRIVADLVNHTLDEVNAALTGAQLQVQQLAPQFSDTVAAGNVISLDPPAGSEVGRGSVVQVVVSMGPDTVPLPDLKGQTADQAKATVESLGLVLGGSSGPPASPVLATSPPAGTPVKRGTAIFLLLG